jgi:SAM-dependent methyltransferase
MAYNPSTYWNDIFKDGVNAQSVCYPEWPLSYNHFLHRQQLETLEHILQQENIDLKNKKIIEIGPGAGFWTSVFQHYKVVSYTGIDISKPSIENLSAQFPNYNFIHADIGKELFSNHHLPKADIIFAAMVFLHITDNSKLKYAFKQLNELLLPGGKIIFLDAIVTKKVFGNAKSQTDGPEFNEQFHNKIRPIELYKSIAKNLSLSLNTIIPAFNTSQYCYDFNSYLGYVVWGKAFYWIHRKILNQASEKTGLLYARIQTNLDNIITKIFKMGMSSKWIIMNKN